MGPYKFKFPKPNVILTRLKLNGCLKCDRYFLDQGALRLHQASHQVKVPDKGLLNPALVIESVKKESEVKKEKPDVSRCDLKIIC